MAPEPTPEALAACGEADCRAALVRAAWEEGDRELTTQLLLALPEDLERVALVIEISEDDPGSARELCEVLPTGPDQRRCTKINLRPHLQTDNHLGQAAEEAARSRSAPGPVLPEFHPPPHTSRYAGLGPVDTDCAEAPDPNGCRTRAAVKALVAGEAERAVGHCRSAEGETWQEECLFRAAELSLTRNQGATYTESAEVCAAMSGLAHRCQDHLVWRIARLGPGAAAPRAEWARAEARARALHDYWSARVPEAADDAVDRYWALLLAWAYRSATTAGAVPLQAEAARPHLRAEISRALVEDSDPATTDLGALVSAAEAALARPVRGGQRRARSGLEGDLRGWPDDARGGEDIPAVRYRNEGRRALADSVRDDLAVAILEAAARTEPPREGLLAAGLDWPHPLVAWTAERLREPNWERPQPEPGDHPVGGTAPSEPPPGDPGTAPGG